MNGSNVQIAEPNSKHEFQKTVDFSSSSSVVKARPSVAVGVDTPEECVQIPEACKRQGISMPSITRTMLIEGLAKTLELSLPPLHTPVVLAEGTGTKPEENGAAGAGAADQKPREIQTQPQPQTQQPSPGHISTQPTPTPTPMMIQAEETHQTPMVRAQAQAEEKPTVTRFHAQTIPGITIQAYLERVTKLCKVSNEATLVAVGQVLFIHRYTVILDVNRYSIHRLLLTALRIATKIMDDQHYDNASFAAVGGITTAEMNLLEIELLFALQFGFHVCSEGYAKLFEMLVLEDQSMPSLHSLTT